MGIRFRVRDKGIGMSPEFLPHPYEDNEINIYVAQLILEKAGCVVEIAKRCLSLP